MVFVLVVFIFTHTVRSKQIFATNNKKLTHAVKARQMRNKTGLISHPHKCCTRLIVVRKYFMLMPGSWCRIRNSYLIPIMVQSERGLITKTFICAPTVIA